MKTIPLTQGKFAIVDDEDYDRLNQHKWYAQKVNQKYYAVCKKYLRGSGRKNQKSQMILMHREIMGAQQGEQIDHINCNSLDNKRRNLRFSTQQQNLQNSRKQKGCSSKYKGVHSCKQTKKWRTEITHNYQNIHLGYFNTEIEAAKAYDKKAIELFGQFAHTNF